MDQIDSLSPDLRALVNEEGWTLVDNFMRCGVQKASQIRHLLKLVREGTSAYGNVGRSEAFETRFGQRVPKDQ